MRPTARAGDHGLHSEPVTAVFGDLEPGIQHMFAQKYTLEVRYVGTRGIHLPVQTRLNVQSQYRRSDYLPTFTSGSGTGYAEFADH